MARLRFRSPIRRSALTGRPRDIAPARIRVGREFTLVRRTTVGQTVPFFGKLVTSASYVVMFKPPSIKKALELFRYDVSGSLKKGFKIKGGPDGFAQRTIATDIPTFRQAILVMGRDARRRF